MDETDAQGAAGGHPWVPVSNTQGEDFSFNTGRNSAGSEHHPGTQG